MFDDNDTNCNYDVNGINAQYGFNSKMLNDNTNITKNQMMGEIRSICFAITDIAEYLNTHPNDEKALCLHEKYCNELKNLEETYQKAFGPLTIYCPCDKWKWLDNPWPWEGSEQ